MEKVKLGSICKLRQGFQVPLPEQEVNNKPGYVRFIRIVDYTQQTDDIRYVKENEKYYYVEPDDVVMIRYGAAGEVGHGIRGVIANNMFLIEPQIEINKNYLYYYLSQKRIREKLLATSTSTTMPALNFKIVNELDIPLYDKREQDYFVKLFDLLSGIIQKRKTELQKLDEIIKARFVELFGLPVSNTKGWKTELMSEVAPTVNYSGKFDDDVWLLNLDMVEAQTGKILDYLIVSEEEVGNSTCTFDTSNVLYSKLRPYLNKVVIPDRCGYATSELVPLQPIKSKINREYLAFMLRSDEFVAMINEKVAGAKMPRVSMGDFRKFDVPIPPMELQNQFADFVQQVDKSKFEVQKSLDETQILMDSLMQQYFG